MYQHPPNQDYNGFPVSGYVYGHPPRDHDPRHHEQWLPGQDGQWYPLPQDRISEHYRHYDQPHHDARTTEKIADLEDQLHRLKTEYTPTQHHKSPHHPRHVEHDRGRKFFRDVPFASLDAGARRTSAPSKDRSRSSSPGWDSASTLSGSKRQGGQPSTKGWDPPNQPSDDKGGRTNVNKNDTTTGWNFTNQVNNNCSAWADTNKDNADGNNNQTTDSKSKASDDSPMNSGANNPTAKSEPVQQDNNTNDGDNGGWGDKNNEKNSSDWDKPQASWTGDAQTKDEDKGKNSKSKSKDKKEGKKKKKGQDSESTTSSSDEEKPYTRSYWATQIRDGRGQTGANSSRKRDKLTIPEDPIYTISEETSKEMHLKHQVRGGRGAEQQKKTSGSKPLYWDNFEEPYAVFRFKYRSRGESFLSCASCCSSTFCVCRTCVPVMTGCFAQPNRYL